MPQEQTITHIAVVNDDTSFLDLMAELLAAEGYEASVLRESDNAFETLRANPPDLVILDVRMDTPERGWMICELLKLCPETRHLPLVVCSAALDDLRGRVDWLRAHGIGALPKPFDIDDLYASVRTALETSEPSFLGLEER